MEPGRVRAASDAEVRRNVGPDGSGALIEAGRHVVRWVGADGRGWSGIAWSGLGDADADAVIAEQVDWFAARREKFEWKLYDYDRPPDLARRLLAAGFAAGGEESLMVAEVSAVPAQAALPSWVRLLPVTGPAGAGLLIEVHERVFGTGHSRLYQVAAGPAARPPGGDSHGGGDGRGRAGLLGRLARTTPYIWDHSAQV